MGAQVLKELHRVAIDFARREYSEAASSADSVPAGDGTAARWRRIIEMGWPGLLIPTEFGGSALDLGHMAAVIAPIAAMGDETPLVETGAVVPALLTRAGTEDQQAQLLSRIADGAIVATALWEQPKACEFGSVQTIARSVDGGYMLTGSKMPVAHGTSAEYLLVMARVEEEPGFGVFVVESNADGVSVVPLRATADPAPAAIDLSDVFIPRDGRLSGASDVAAAVRYAMDVGAVLASVQLLAYAKRGLELTIDYVQKRHQFGRPIGSFQAVKHHCADMYRDVEAMRVACAGLLRHQFGDDLSFREVSIAKAKTSTSARLVLEMAHQLHGGIGFYADYPLERLYRRSLVVQGMYGSASWHRSRLVSSLQEDPASMRRNQIAV